VADDTLEKLFIIVDEKGRWDSNETLKFKFTQSFMGKVTPVPRDLIPRMFF
jgi:hypothetical protein